MSEKEEDEIELSKIPKIPSDDVDFDDFHTPEAPTQRKRPKMSLKDILSSPRRSKRGSPKNSDSDSPRKRSSIPYHQRIAGGTRVSESKNDLDDLMKSNAVRIFINFNVLTQIFNTISTFIHYI